MTDLACRGIPRNSARQLFRIRVLYAGWVTITRRSDGLRKSIPVVRRRAVPIIRAGGSR
jgi:hypothetical protein